MNLLQAQVDAFRAQKPGEDTDPSWNLLTGMTLPKSFKTEHEHPQAPVFTHMNDNNFPNLYRDDKIVIYLNSALPYLEAYPGAEGRAAMSFVHLLVVPIERVYNIATMHGEEDLNLLMYMRDTTLSALGQTEFRQKVADAIHQQNSEKVSTDAFLEAMRRFRDAKNHDFSFWFHEHPKHSVGHLHMHVLLDTTLTDAFKIHKHKNMSFDDAVHKFYVEDK